MKKKVLWSTVAASIMLVSWGFLSSNNSIKAKEIPSKETSVSTSDSEKKTEKNSTLKPEARYVWGTRPSTPLSTFGPMQPDFYKPVTDGVAESFSNLYSFQPRITSLTKIYRAKKGYALTEPPNTLARETIKPKDDVGYQIVATHMGLKNGRWVDVKYEYIDRGPNTNSYADFYVGLSKAVKPGQNPGVLLFSITYTGNSEPIFRMSLIDHDSGEPIRMGSGHVTFGDVDYNEWIKVKPVGGTFNYLTARTNNGILTDQNNFGSDQVTIIAPAGNTNADTYDFSRYFSVGYEDIDYLDIQYSADKSVVNISQIEMPETMFELERPSLIADTDENLEDEVITYSLLQPIPYRASIGKLSSLAFEGTVDDSMSFNKSDIQVYDQDDKNVTANFVSAVDSKNPQKFTLVALPTYTDSLVDKTEQLRIDVKTTLNKTNDAYKKYQNNATGQLTIPFQMKLKYANAGGADAGDLRELDSNIAFGHINLKKITINYKDELGKSLQASQTELGFLGDSVTYSAPTIEGYNLKSPKEVDGTDNFADTEKNVDYVYEKVTPNVTLEQSVDKAKAQPGETLHYKLNIGSVQETPKDLDTRTVSVEYWDDLGQKIRTDSTYTIKKGSSYDFSEIPAVEGFDGIAATVTSNAKGTVADDDIVIKMRGFKATLNLLVQKKVRYVDENDQPISDDVTYLGRDKYIPNYSVKAKVIPGYVISDGQESYPVIFNATSPDEYVFKYRSSRNYNSLKITEVLDSKLENPTNFTWNTKEAVEIPNDSITYDEATRKITATSPTDGIAFNHESTIEFDAKVASTATANYVISQTANFKAGYLADGTIDVSTKTPAETVVTLDSELTIHFVDEKGENVVDPLIIQTKLGQKLNLKTTPTIIQKIADAEAKYYGVDASKRPSNEESYIVSSSSETVTYYFVGSLKLVSVPSILDFGLENMVGGNVIRENSAQYTEPLKIADTRPNEAKTWTLKAALTKSLTSEDQSVVLPDAIRYKNPDKAEFIMNGSPQVLYANGNSTEKVYDISSTWGTSKDSNGFKFEIPAVKVSQLGKYSGEITYYISDTYEP